MVLHDWLVNAVSGGTAGASVDFVLFPLDTIKTRLQSSQKVPINRGFYAGLFSAMAGSFPSAAVFFTVYEGSKVHLEKHFSKDVVPAMSATIADVATCSVRVPFEVVKQRMQVGLHTTTLEAVQTIIRVEGFRGLYRGYTSTVAREIPFDAVEFLLYEKLKRYWAQKQGRSVTPQESSVMGCFAGGFAAAVTTPLDVVKTRLMTQSLSKDGTQRQYTGVLHALKTIYREEGLMSLFKGIGPRVAWISLGGGIFFGVYEFTKSHLLGEHKASNDKHAAE
eukprot:TRINITY_DN12992_c0_g1_i1.p1 TRINITY_DN12992_c0_g1~~TRINITY_DN12992_c0_g1_i1.p1  ORF type:complete len:278 (-),score=57.97 TRINITY_DN12992_c0_g1_i1:47-880(-)